MRELRGVGKYFLHNINTNTMVSSEYVVITVIAWIAYHENSFKWLYRQYLDFKGNGNININHSKECFYHMANSNYDETVANQRKRLWHSVEIISQPKFYTCAVNWCCDSSQFMSYPILQFCCGNIEIFILINCFLLHEE